MSASPPNGWTRSRTGDLSVLSLAPRADRSLRPPAAAGQELTLEAIGEYPIITYHEGFTGRTHIDKAFADAGVVPDIVLSAIDADVIKTYVELDLGVGIVASMAYDGFKDRNLALIPVPHLFPESTTRLAVRRGIYLRSYAWRSSRRSARTLVRKTSRQSGTD
jgi:DNA-binding transcriptional LysR family regulator